MVPPNALPKINASYKRKIGHDDHKRVARNFLKPLEDHLVPRIVVFPCEGLHLVLAVIKFLPVR
jgi:hypothetical protein